jgi:hypothetical protein
MVEYYPMQNDSVASLKLFRVKARETYDKIKNPAWCKCLNRKINFNAQGFHHLLYDGLGHERSSSEQRYKLLLVPLIPSVLATATDATYKKVMERINRKKNSPVKEIEYWSLTALVGRDRDVKVKVILKRVGAGQIIFWSVMRLKTSKKDH